MAYISSQKFYLPFLRSKSKFPIIQKVFRSDETTTDVDCSKYRKDSCKSGKGLALPKSIKEATSSPEELEYEWQWRSKPIQTPKEEFLSETNEIPRVLQLTRTARIFKVAKNCMQSGTNNTRFWRVMFDTQERWENPLMGWTSTGDAISNVQLHFLTLGDAIRHCQRNAWDYYVDRPRDVNLYKARSYNQNFAWNRRYRVSTK
ncbi:nadh-ubiquinone oxidoreductase [Holotrichia oblita]|uniref:Nadh-ubiquinone oxidoreductase n=1 Tax=Holotrichia oblita TaxID=644536 RepID=A0ACB9T649_HOLOL|nr:nadh-ubiquinone oxidoreductase [Holotrichia oblita]